MKLQTKNNTRLGGYLTASVACSTLAGTASAAIVQLDVSTLTGPNTGLGEGQTSPITFASLGGSIAGGFIRSTDDFYRGLHPGTGMEFAWQPAAVASPAKFSAGDLISPSGTFFQNRYHTVFLTTAPQYSTPVGPGGYGGYGGPGGYGGGGGFAIIPSSPNFDAGSFMGFRVDDGNGEYNYGYLEVTWTAATNTFEILSGAYEDQPGVAISAGAIPEPSTAVLSLGALAAGVFIRRRKQAA